MLLNFARAGHCRLAGGQLGRGFHPYWFTGLIILRGDFFEVWISPVPTFLPCKLSGELYPRKDEFW
jgi:hypothetical protein